MAKVIKEGPAKPDDEIYSTGAVIGGRRIGKMVLMELKRDASREEQKAVFLAFLKKLGVRIKEEEK